MRFLGGVVAMVVVGSFALTGCAGSAEPPSEDEKTESSSEALVWAICHPGNPCSRCGTHDTIYWQDGDKGGVFCSAAVAAPAPSQVPKSLADGASKSGAVVAPPSK